MSLMHLWIRYRFQSTLPNRERLDEQAYVMAAVEIFQSTLPNRERPQVLLLATTIILHFVLSQHILRTTLLLGAEKLVRML